MTGALAEAAKTRRCVKEKNIGLSALVKYMDERDWNRVYDNQFDLRRLGEAIENTSKRKKLPITEVAEEYHITYFGPAFPIPKSVMSVRNTG